MKNSPSFKNLACGRFMLLFCRGRQKFVQNVTHVHGDCFYSIDLGEQGWRSGENTRFPKSLMFVFVVGSCSEGFTPVLRFTKKQRVLTICKKNPVGVTIA